MIIRHVGQADDQIQHGVNSETNCIFCNASRHDGARRGNGRSLCVGCPGDVLFHTAWRDVNRATFGWGVTDPCTAETASPPRERQGTGGPSTSRRLLSASWSHDRAMAKRGGGNRDIEGPQQREEKP